METQNARTNRLLWWEYVVAGVVGIFVFIGLIVLCGLVGYLLAMMSS